MKCFDILIAFIGVIGAIYVFISSYKIEVIDSFIVGSTICFVFLFAIILGATVTWAKVAAKINENMNMNLIYYNNLYLNNYEFIISIFLIFVIFIISAFICFSIIYKPNFILLLFVTVPILEIGLYFAIMPSYFYFELLIITWVAVLGMRTIKNKNKTNKSLLQFKRKGKKNIYIVRGNK